MKKKVHKRLSYLILVVLSLTLTAVGQVPQQPKAEPVGEIITSGDSVQINGTVAQRGSTVFSGSEIQTGGASAFVNLTSGGGVLSVAPGSRVKVSREQAKIIAEVLKGSVTVRSSLASTVIAPDRVVNSEPGDLYTVSVPDSGAGAVVQSMLKSVVVKTADGALQMVAAEAAGAVAAAIGPNDSPRPGVDQPAQATNRGQNCFVTIMCSKVGSMLTVTGEVFCGGNDVGGATVVLRIFFSNRAPGLGPFTMTTLTSPPSMVGHYTFGPITNSNIPGGGVAVVEVTNCGPCRDQPVGGNASNRCTF